GSCDWRRPAGRSCGRARRTRATRSRARSGRAPAWRDSHEASSRILPSDARRLGPVVTALVVSDEEDRALRVGARPDGSDLIISAGDLGFDYLSELADRL